MNSEGRRVVMVPRQVLGRGPTRDSKGISQLSPIQLILPYKISIIRGSSEIPLVSLGPTVTQAAGLRSKSPLKCPIVRPSANQRPVSADTDQ